MFPVWWKIWVKLSLQVLMFASDVIMWRGRGKRRRMCIDDKELESRLKSQFDSIWLKFIYLDFELSWVWVRRINSFLKLRCTWVRGNLARFISQVEGWFNLIELSLWLNSNYIKELSKQYCFVNESRIQATNLSHKLKPNQGKLFFIRAEFELPLILIRRTRANSFFSKSNLSREVFGFGLVCIHP